MSKRLMAACLVIIAFLGWAVTHVSITVAAQERPYSVYKQGTACVFIAGSGMSAHVFVLDDPLNTICR